MLSIVKHTEKHIQRHATDVYVKEGEHNLCKGLLSNYHDNTKYTVLLTQIVCTVHDIYIF